MYVLHVYNSSTIIKKNIVDILSLNKIKKNKNCVFFFLKIKQYISIMFICQITFKGKMIIINIYCYSILYLE